MTLTKCCFFFTTSMSGIIIRTRLVLFGQRSPLFHAFHPLGWREQKRWAVRWTQWGRFWVTGWLVDSLKRYRFIDCWLDYGRRPQVLTKGFLCKPTKIKNVAWLYYNLLPTYIHLHTTKMDCLTALNLI